MGFTLQLAHDLVEVEAGSTTPVTVTIANKGIATDRYEIEVEGVDAEWKAIPVPVFAAEPGESHVERFFIKPPRTSENLAGNYPFVVRVRSLESGEQRSVQGVIRLKPFHHLTMEIDPKKGSVSATSHRNQFDITLVNLGNTEHTLQLIGSDPEDACTYEFENEQVTLGAGHQREVSVTVQPVSTPILSSGKLIGFSIAGRSIDTPSVVTTAQAQLERRSLLSPSTLIVAALLALVVGVWILEMPKPPTVQVNANPMRATAGDGATISWTARDANRIRVSVVTADGRLTDVYDGSDLTGSVPVILGPAGPEKIEAWSYKDQRQGQMDSKTIIVDPAHVVVPPVIDSFSASAKEVKKGSSVTLKWKVENAVKVVLAPLNKEFAPEEESYQTPMTDAGKQEFHLVAFSKDGGTATSKSVWVNVIEVSDASIIAFSANPAKLDPGGSTTISWQVTQAVRVELHAPNGQIQTVDPTGTQVFQVSEKAPFTLVAFDTQGRTATRKITVEVNKPPAPPPQPNDTTFPDTATTGGQPTNPPTIGGTTGSPTTG